MEEKCAQCGMTLDEQNKCASDPTLCQNCCPPAEGQEVKPEEGAKPEEAGEPTPPTAE